MTQGRGTELGSSFKLPSLKVFFNITSSPAMLTQVPHELNVLHLLPSLAYLGYGTMQPDYLCLDIVPRITYETELCWQREPSPASFHNAALSHACPSHRPAIPLPSQKRPLLYLQHLCSCYQSRCVAAWAGCDRCHHVWAIQSCTCRMLTLPSRK